MRATVAFACAACLAVPAIAAGAEGPAVVTVVESSAALLRSTGRFALTEGVRLQSGDMIEVGDKGVLQLGFADGTKLSLGPRSRFYLAVLAAPAAERGSKAAAISDFYMLHGWTKFELTRKATPFRITTPLFGLAAADATAVLQVQDAEAGVFAERGELRLAEGFTRATAASPLAVRAGQHYVRKADGKGVIQPRPAAAFVDAMPRQYLDSLPERMARFNDREVVPQRLGDMVYADVEPWLKGPPEVRRPLMQRLRSRARDPAFREALIKNLSFHPEWDRILFPEKYRPKPPPNAATPPAATPGR
jgi:hypothetical protein